MPTFEVIEARRHHCGQMARRLREEQAEATARLGVHTHRRLVEVFDNSSFRRAWLVDGRLCGLGGVEGSLASATGGIWLALTEQACRYPVALVKETRRQLQEIMQTRRQIVTTIIENDSASARFVAHLGFETCGDPIELNGQRLIPVLLGEMPGPS
jgi:hypothetical protein